ncbi:Tigger transposable element-derived protein 2 [Dissophora ornata]|nr:Tigger transposable element-derived protein 2 [Dissophora ornata]
MPILVPQDHFSSTITTQDLSDTYPLETQSNVSRTQTAIVAAASVVQESTVSGDTRSNFGLATQDREGKRQRLSNSIQESNSDETDSQANSQRLVKRQRKALQLQEKLEIIDYWEQNSPISFQKMETHHDVPRTTIYGIIKDRQRLQTLARSQPRAHLTLGTSRMVESRFRVLEELLVAWIMDLRSQCIPVYDKKITTQAFEIHRMLSGLLAEPLPACSFSSGWLKNFKKRRQIGKEIMHGNDPTTGEIAKALEELHSHLVNVDKVWSCDVTHMFLDAIPTRESKDELGHRELRHNSGVFEAEGYDDMAVDAAEEDLTASVFKDWLKKLDSSFSAYPDFNNAVIVDEAFWNLLEIDSRDSTYTFGKTMVIKVPKALNVLMPMGTGIVQELKANYHILSMETRDVTAGQSKEVALEDYLRLIPKAWSRVPKSILECCFKRLKLRNVGFRASSRSQSSNDASLKPTIDAAVEEKLQAALKNVFFAVPDSIIDFYLNQDKDMGPSSFLRAKIQEMKLHGDFEQYFGTPYFGDPALHERESPAHPIQEIWRCVGATI